MAVIIGILGVVILYLVSKGEVSKPEPQATLLPAYGIEIEHEDFSCVALDCKAEQIDTSYGITEDWIKIFNLPSFLETRVRYVGEHKFGYIFACEEHAKLWGIDKIFE